MHKRSAMLIAPMLTALATVSAGPQTAQRTPQAQTRVIAVEQTLEAALGQPRVHVRLANKKAPLTGDPAMPLLDDGRAHSFLAYLDTGASGYVISKTTAQRFGVQAQPEAVYNEVGLHGDTKVGVSQPYEVALAGATGELDEIEPAAAAFELAQEQARLQLTLQAPGGAMALLGEMNVVGMPAIAGMVIEIDPAPMRQRADDGRKPDLIDQLASFGGGPAVKLHDRKTRPKDVDVAIALEYKDFNQRKHEENRGPLPELANNPVIPGVVCEHDDPATAAMKTSTGEWLLDTGAAASIISVKTAQALGLYDAGGAPARQPDFTLPLGGIGGGGEGQVKSANGFIIDRVKISCRNRMTLEFRDARVVVQNVGVKLSGEREVILDGVLGMNLLLPSGAGFGAGLPEKTDDGPFDRIWVDGPRGTLGLKIKS
jgi:hypothetical protein